MTVQNAYCNECAKRVQLTDAGECPNGHARSALRDVCEGVLAASESAPVQKPSGLSAATRGPAPSTELPAQIIGKLIVIVPAAIVVILALWSGYAGSVAMGLTPVQSWVSAIGSLAMTGAVVAFLVWNRRRKM